MSDESSSQWLAAIAIVVSPTICGIAEEAVAPGHDVIVTIPEGWERYAEVSQPILIASAERGTGNSLGLLAFEQPDVRYTLDRKSAEAGLMKELGADGKILRRSDAKLGGVPAYCVVAETQIQGQKISIARIMGERPLNGFVYAVQYSRLDGRDIDDASIQEILSRLHWKESQ